MIANETRGELSITLEGVEYGLRPSWQAIDAIERQTGKSLHELGAAAETYRLSVGELATIVTECIRAWGRANEQSTIAAFQRDRIAEILIEDGVLAAQARVALVLLLAVTGGVTAQGEVKPERMTTGTTPDASSSAPLPLPLDGAPTNSGRRPRTNSGARSKAGNG